MARWLFHPGANLPHRVFRAGFWGAALRISMQLLGTARILVLARLLDPKDFGVFGVALVSMGFLQAILHFGFGDALIQKKGDIVGYLNTTWVLQIVRGMALALVLILGAPFIAAFLNVPEATTLVQVMALALLLRGFRNSALVHFARDLELHKSFFLQLFQTLAEVVVGIVLAVIWRNAWALVLSVIAGEIVALVVSYIIHPYRPRLRFEWAKFKELYHFGLWLNLSSMVSAFTSQMDSLILGRLFGPVSLGSYQIANRLAFTVSRQLSPVIDLVSFPAYAKLQDEVPRLRRAYLLSLGMTSVFMFPVAVAIYVLAHDGIALIIGAKWMSAVAAVQLIALAGSFRVMSRVCNALLLGSGHPRFGSMVDIAVSVASLGLLYPFIHWWGVTGAAAVVLLGALAHFLPTLAFSFHVLRIGWWNLCPVLVVTLVLSASVGAPLLLGKVWLAPLNLLEFGLLVIAGGITYVASAAILWRVFNIGPLKSFEVLNDAKNSG